MSLRVEPAQQADLQTLAALWCEKMLLVTPVRATDCMSKLAHLTSLLASARPGLVLVVRDGDEIAGYVTAYLADTGVVVDDLTLDTHQMRAQAARMLVHAVTEWASERQQRRLVVRMQQITAVEQAFWLSLGAVMTAVPEQGTVEYWLTL